MAVITRAMSNGKHCLLRRSGGWTTMDWWVGHTLNCHDFNIAVSDEIPCHIPVLQVHLK